MANKKGTSHRKVANAKAGKRKVYGPPMYDANGKRTNLRKTKTFALAQGYTMDSMR